MIPEATFAPLDILPEAAIGTAEEVKELPLDVALNRFPASVDVEDLTSGFL